MLLQHTNVVAITFYLILRMGVVDSGVVEYQSDVLYKVSRCNIL